MPLNVSIELIESITKACCVLHNYVRKIDGYRNDETDFGEIQQEFYIALHDIAMEENVQGGRTANKVKRLLHTFWAISDNCHGGYLCVAS